MTEDSKLIPKPEEEGATSAAMSQLVPQRRFDLPPLSNDRSADTLLRHQMRHSRARRPLFFRFVNKYGIFCHIFPDLFFTDVHDFILKNLVTK